MPEDTTTAQPLAGVAADGHARVTLPLEGTVLETPPAGESTSATRVALDNEAISAEKFREVKNEAQNLRKRLRELEQAEAQRAAEAAEAERKRLEEAQQFKDLYESERAQREKAEATIRLREMEALKAEVGAEAKLPREFWSLLQGDSKDSLMRHAQTLVKAMPAPPAPAYNGGPTGGSGGAHKPGEITDADRHQAARSMASQF